MTGGVQHDRFHVLSPLVVDRTRRSSPPRSVPRRTPWPLFVIQYCGGDSASPTQDILHAIDHALAIEDAGEDPDRWLIIGPDTAAKPAVVVMITAEGNQIAIHAMPMRDRYARLLEP